MRLKNAFVFDAHKGFIKRDLFINGDMICENSNGEELNLENCYIIPGLTDLHFHGCVGHDFSDGDIDGIKKMAEYELSCGITQICPTGMTLATQDIDNICSLAAQYSKTAHTGAKLVGIQLEGPFFSEKKKGAQNADFLKLPNLELYERWQKKADGLIKIIAIAPELDGAIELISAIKDNVTVSLAHTAATYNEADLAFKAGAKQVTHLFNAMNAFAHRDPGPVGAAADSDCFVELICDGIHIHPAMVRSVFKLFGPNRVILISDTMRAAGMSDGTYMLGGQKVIVSDSKATLSDGTIAGSTTNLMECLRRAVSFGIPLHSAVMAASVNPAKSLNIFNKYGSLDIGKTANIVVLNLDLSLRHIIFNGEW